MADGYSGTAVKERTIQSMKAPTVTLESGKTAGTDTVSPDEVLTEIKSTASAAGLEYQYLLTDRKLDTVSECHVGKLDRQSGSTGRRSIISMSAQRPRRTVLI